MRAGSASNTPIKAGRMTTARDRACVALGATPTIRRECRKVGSRRSSSTCCASMSERGSVGPRRGTILKASWRSGRAARTRRTAAPPPGSRSRIAITRRCVTDMSCSRLGNRECDEAERRCALTSCSGRLLRHSIQRARQITSCALTSELMLPTISPRALISTAFEKNASGAKYSTVESSSR